MVTPRFAPLVGGVETHTAEVAKRMVATGHAVTVLTTDPSGRLPAVADFDGVRVQRVRAWPAHRDYYLAPGLLRVIVGRRKQWDIMHCQSYHTAVAPLAMLAASAAGIPFVVTFHSGGHSVATRHHARTVQRRYLGSLLRRAQRMIAVSQFEARLFREDLKLACDRIVVIPNGAHLPALPVDNERDGHTGALILSVGRLERYKGHQRVIAAMPHVLYQRPDARLKIVGAGPYEPALRRLIGTLGLSDQIEITSVPASDRAGMARLVSQADVFTLLSEYEAHPIAVMEALMLKRPVLVAYAAGLAEIADRGLAHAIPLESSPQAVAAAILHSLEHPLIPTDVHWTTWDECAEQVLALYRDILGVAPCAS